MTKQTEEELFNDLPTYDDVVEASQILNGVAHRTPVLTSTTLNDQLGNGIEVFVKGENFQRMGAFKFRGGYNALWHYYNEELLTKSGENGEKETKKSEKEGNVVTFSSGNHAQAIALSAKLLNINATIIMPKDAPTLKVNATKGYGGNVVFYDRYTEDRIQIAKEIQSKMEGSVAFIPPYDHKHVIAGQGTAGKELFEDVDGSDLDYLFVCVGGGGLISGCALAAKHFNPNCKVIGVEPEAGNDAQRSLAEGQIVHIATPNTIADGAQTQHVGKLTFEIMKTHLEKIMTVSDQELVNEMKFFGERMKLIVEPTGCLGLAGLRKAVRAGEIPPNSKCGVIISGGNVDLSRYGELLTKFA